VFSGVILKSYDTFNSVMYLTLETVDASDHLHVLCAACLVHLIYATVDFA
jgi:hypothetical protein